MVYVDYDPIVLSHARALLDSTEQGATEYIEADLRDTGTILEQAACLLDFTGPVAVTMLAILHAVPDADDPHAITARLLGAVPSGSYLAISYPGAVDLTDPETKHRLDDAMEGKMQQQFTWRDRDQVARLFTGTDLVEPGLVPAEDWRPELGATEAGKSNIWCAIGRKA